MSVTKPMSRPNEPFCHRCATIVRRLAQVLDTTTQARPYVTEGESAVRGELHLCLIRIETAARNPAPLTFEQRLALIDDLSMLADRAAAA